MTRDIDRFRRLCGQYRWLAVFMVASVGLLLAGSGLIAPLVLSARTPDLVSGREVIASVIWITPTLCYLFGVWSIGAGMGQLAKGRLIQPTLAATLRRVGLALGFGGVISVFVVTNLLRLIGSTEGGYLHFDVAGMTLGMIGGALFLLGRVVDQASEVQAELDEMV
ncbi:DUF2975 domain-containing protein [Brevundimonas sp.]|uniref:DUF2975 domain-containing protein n=1 Tax=Brevundimonas sp. TaxID=1871086 RepID=UPI0028A1EC88|nr:DUF2975 domain-containing protein [Brevundimonas sp.]